MFNNIIRGGQTNIHSFRMIAQVVRAAMFVALLLGMVSFIWKCNRDIPMGAYRQYYEYLVAETNLAVQLTPNNKVTQLYQPPNFAKPYRRKSASIIRDKMINETIEAVDGLIYLNAVSAFQEILYLVLALFTFWFIKGFYGKQKKHKRGTRIDTPSNIRRRLWFRRLASDIKLGELPLVKDSETSHILIAGTTGSGKSNCFNLLLPQVRKRGEKAVIFDPTGEYVARFYRKNKDHILNPFDRRTEGWNIWAEFDEQYELEKLASALIPSSTSNSDPFWVESARALFIYAAKKQQTEKNFSSKEFINLILSSSPDILRTLLVNTPVASMLDKENNKQLLSIKSTLMNYIRCFEYLEDIKEDEKPFSITKWIGKGERQPKKETSVTEEDLKVLADYEDPSHRDSWLFITCKPAQRTVLRPLFSIWIDVGMSALMNQPPNQARRCWFFIDELPTLHKLPSLRVALAESRKYGGCVVAGMQSLNQMNEIYGNEASKAMLNMFNTEIYFRMIESHNREMISRALGEAEEDESSENISYGANTMRDGISSQTHTKTRRLVTASELRHLKDLEAFISLPKIDTITKLTMPYAETQGFDDAFHDRGIDIINNTFQNPVDEDVRTPNKEKEEGRQKQKQKQKEEEEEEEEEEESDLEMEVEGR
jgi:type IV conjugative transfer system coupling protein TraD